MKTTIKRMGGHTMAAKTTKAKKAFRFKEKEISGKTRIVVTTRRGRVLDDAQGYGYKDTTAAYRAYTYKQKQRQAAENPVMAAV